jgi:hypothetical protein
MKFFICAAEGGANREENDTGGWIDGRVADGGAGSSDVDRPG